MDFKLCHCVALSSNVFPEKRGACSGFCQGEWEAFQEQTHQVVYVYICG